jgi:hypothetical protein
MDQFDSKVTNQGKRSLGSANAGRPNDEALLKLNHEARVALESLAGRAFRDHEWVHMQRRLTEFCAILSDWQKQAARRKQEAP